MPFPYTNGDVLNAADLNAIGSYTTYTPTVRQSGTLTYTATYAKYSKINDLVIGSLYLNITSTGTGGNFIIASHPIAPVITGDQVVGSFYYIDASTSVRYAGVTILNTATWGGFFCGIDQSGILGSLPNIVAGSGDIIFLTFAYEAA